MTQNKKILYISISVALLLIGYFVFRVIKKSNPNPDYSVGQVLDSLNGVYVYYNGSIENIEEENVSIDGYKLGLKHHSEEFIKRYYYEKYKHKMPNVAGNPEEFFDPKVGDGELNTKRDLLQFANPSFSLPAVGDILILKRNKDYLHGHVAIVSNIYDGALEVIQQNPGPFKSSRALFGYGDFGNKYKIDDKDVLGWLRIKDAPKTDSVSVIKDK
jgi:hypothetical protein